MVNWIKTRIKMICWTKITLVPINARKLNINTVFSKSSFDQLYLYSLIEEFRVIIFRKINIAIILHVDLEFHGVYQKSIIWKNNS